MNTDLSQPSPYDAVVQWPFLTSEWQDSVLPLPTDIDFRVVGTDARFTKVEVTLRDLYKLIQHIADKRAARTDGKKDPLEIIANEITQTA